MTSLTCRGGGCGALNKQLEPFGSFAGGVANILQDVSFQGQVYRLRREVAY